MTPTERLIKLEEDDPAAVQVMVYWMYHNELCIPYDMEHYVVKDTSDEEAMKTSEGLLVRLCVLAQKYQLPKLQNTCIDAFLDVVRDEGLRLGIISYAYRNTSAGSSLRCFLLEVALHQITPFDIDERKGNICEDFLLDLVKAFCNEMSASPYRLVDPGYTCRLYHSHEDNKYECQERASWSSEAKTT